MLIVIEGCDGSGKSTQYGLLQQAMSRRGQAYRAIKFPQYNSESSSLVRMYLAGEFGSDADSVDPYVASTFYAADRVASYLHDWKQFYDSGRMVIVDRYTTANAIHQGAKLSGEARHAYIEWLFDFEYNILKLPRPDMVIWLDMPPQHMKSVLKSRGGGDIHEDNTEYLLRSYETSREIAGKYGWHRINCEFEGAIRTQEDIHNEIIAAVDMVVKS